VMQANPTGWDGVTLFHASHPDFNGGTYNNTHALVLNGDNFNTVWSNMASYTGENGEPLGVMADTLIVPPQLKRAGLQVINNELLVNGGTNELKGWANLLVLPHLANQATTWYLADLSKAIKPFLWQVFDEPTFIARDNPEDPKVFDQDKFTYGTTPAHYNVGGTLPFLINRSVG
jgi:phage major head subunit gpT-like protein